MNKSRLLVTICKNNKTTVKVTLTKGFECITREYNNPTQSSLRRVAGVQNTNNPQVVLGVDSVSVYAMVRNQTNVYSGEFFPSTKINANFIEELE